MSDQDVHDNEVPEGMSSQLDGEPEEQKHALNFIKDVLYSCTADRLVVEVQSHTDKVSIPAGSHRFKWDSVQSGEVFGTRTPEVLGWTITLELEDIGQRGTEHFFDLLCTGIGGDINYRLVADDWAHAIELAEDFVEQFLEYRIGNILKSLSRSSGSTPNEVLYSILAPKDPESALCVPFKVKPTSVTFDIAECDPAVLDALKRRGVVAKIILPEEEETPADAENS